MENWVKLTELGERKCTAVKFKKSDIIKIYDNGNYNFTKEYRVQGEEWTIGKSNFRFDISANNVCDYNINEGADAYYNWNAVGQYYQGNYNGKDYYITYDGENVQWEWTEPVYYYGFGNEVDEFNNDPYATNYIYVMLEGEGGNEEPEEQMTIAENLNRIIQAKANIKAAIENKGVAVGDLTIDSYAEKIGEIPQGDVSLSGLDFTVIGYDMALTKELNDKFNADIQYSLQKYNEWDENKTSAMNLFKEDKKLVYAPFINTQNVEDMYNMFSNCTNLTTVPLIDTSKVWDMQGMFNNCINLITVPLFDTHSSKKMGSMFANCTNLTTVPLFNTQNVTNMSSMFEYCTNLTTVPLFNTQNVTNMGSMFYNCKNLTTVSQFDTSNVTAMNNMFYGCTNLKTIPQFDTSNVTNINSLFYNCTALESLPLLECGKVADKSMVFGSSTISNLTTLGGFKDLKVDWSDNYGLNRCSNLTYESVMNVINNLYDFRANGDETTTKAIKFHSNSLALLSDDDKAIATLRGWILK